LRVIPSNFKPDIASYREKRPKGPGKGRKTQGKVKARPQRIQLQISQME